jgi:hypothetical protein
MNSLGSWPRGVPSTLDLIPDGFEFTQGGKPQRILWHEIVRIDAGMRDYLTVDLFYAVIHTARAQVTIDELVDGFRQFEQRVFDGWPQTRTQWLSLQATALHHPRFETLWQA